MPLLKTNCPHCQGEFGGHLFSRSWSGCREFICDKCGVLLHLMPNDNAARYLETIIPPGKGTRMERARLLFSRHLKPCSCGGLFQYHDDFDLCRCPHCKKELDREFIRKIMGVDPGGWGGPGAVIDGETISYDNPSIEINGLIQGDTIAVWREGITESGFQSAMEENREWKRIYPIILKRDAIKEFRRMGKLSRKERKRRNMRYRPIPWPDFN